MNEAKSIKQVFLEAIEFDSLEARERLLAEACQGDLAKRRKVEALLDAHDQPESWFEESPVKTDLRQTDDPLKRDGSLEKPGDTIGQYKLLQPIGEGGFGVVYMAEQRSPIQRMVALKIIKPGMDSREVIARFEAERQALAMMDHPNIARVLDAGQTDNGRPYFAMELVRGVPITDYADKNELTIHDRLQLFVTVCRAIQHAHHKGIIHRDIKPSNVMVTLHDGTAVVKVIDFGVAKALRQKLTEKTLFTTYGQMIGTPHYMSPEQAEMSGLDVDTRTDLFSLGVLLYELLTGSTPLELERLRAEGYAEIQRLIREEDAPRLSDRLSTMGDDLTVVAKHRKIDPTRLQQIVRGDLDWIVMTCLEKDRNRRYDSANGLAQDIERYLSDEPVVARPPSMAYRFEKAWRRNKVVYTAALAVASALVAGTVVSVWQAREAIRARNEAQDNLGEAIVAQGLAQDARNAADAEKVRAIRAAADLRRHLYVGDIGLAFEAIQRGDLGRAQTLLGNHLPSPDDDDDLRGFEWRYLWSRSQGNYTADLGPYRSFLSGVAVSPDGQFVALNRRDPWRVAVIRLATGTEEQSIAMPDAVSPLIYSPSGNVLVGRHQGKIVGWDTRTWEAREPLALDSPLAFGHGTEEEMFVAREGDHLSVWNATQWKKIADLVNTPGAGPLLVPGYGEQGHMTNVLAVSSDDRFVYLAGANGIRRWDCAERTELAPFHLDASPSRGLAGWAEGLACLATSARGQLAVGDRWGNVRLIDPQTGHVLHTFQSHIGWVSCLKFARDGTRLVSGGGDRNVVLYDPVKRSILDRLLGHGTQVWGLDISADGTTIASGSGYGGHILTWSLAEASGWALERAGIQNFAIMEDSRILFLRDAVNDAEFYDPIEGTLEPARAERFVQILRERRAIPLAASPHGKWVVTKEGNTLIVWDVATAERVRTLSHDSGEIAKAGFAPAVFSPDSRYLVTSGKDSEVRLWRTNDWTSKVLCQHVPRTLGIGFSGNSRRVAVSDENKYIRVFDLTGGLRQVLEKKEALKAWSVALSISGRWLAVGHADQKIHVWDLETMKKVKTLEGQTNSAFSLSFSPDDKTLASSNFSTVKLWHVATWQVLISVNADANPVQFSPDGRYLASMVFRSGSDVFPGEDAGLRVWKTPTLQVIDAKLDGR